MKFSLFLLDSKKLAFLQSSNTLTDLQKDRNMFSRWMVQMGAEAKTPNKAFFYIMENGFPVLELSFIAQRRIWRPYSGGLEEFIAQK